jgi:glucoamylase
VHWAKPGVPALRLTNTHRGGRYRIHKEIVADPERDVVLQRTRFEILEGDPAEYRLYLIVAPHLGDQGCHNTASFGSFKGAPMLYAKSAHSALAVTASSGWKGRSVGYVGRSDGWQDLSRHQELQWHYDLAKEGNVALTGEIHLNEVGEFILAIGFGNSESEAAFAAHVSLAEGFDRAWSRYLSEWDEWHGTLPNLDETPAADRLYRTSAAILRVHEAVDQKGARVASLSTPWGEARDEEKAAGYHAVWARDCAQSALGLLAAGARPEVLRTLDYLQCVQEADGHWPQVIWVDGKAYWEAIQIDSIAAPLLLYEIAKQEGLFDGNSGVERYWPMVQKSAEFICRNGPISEQDRWERNEGFSVYTLSVAIAALVIAGEAARENGRKDLSACLLETADAWNAQMENWTYAVESKLARDLALPGFYCRIVPRDKKGRPGFTAAVPLENSEIQKKTPAGEMVSPDVWALVRYGLRRADDPRVCDTTRAIDLTLKTVTPRGPVWHRFNYDGYGESADGGPLGKQGIGRGWPLLSGERAHYELARGQFDEVKALRQALQQFAGDVGMLPEQIWDAGDIPKKGLFLGCATGSARPLAWAHAEYMQLVRSIRDGRVFSCPQVVKRRYTEERTAPRHTPWRIDLQTLSVIPGTLLRIETPGPVTVAWRSGPKAGTEVSAESPVHLHFTDLPTQNLTGNLTFSFCATEDQPAPATDVFEVKL